jgi:hypothetical protein
MTRPTVQSLPSQLVFLVSVIFFFSSHLMVRLNNLKRLLLGFLVTIVDYFRIKPGAYPALPYYEGRL